MPEPPVPTEDAGPDAPPAGDARPVLVVGVGPDATSAAALAAARKLGRALGASLRAVHAVDLDDYPVDPDADDWGPDARTAAAAAAASAALAGYEPPWSWRTVRGDAAAALLDEADRLDAWMIVVGAPRRPLGRLGHRSVATRLVAHAARPVLVVGTPPAPPRALTGSRRHRR